MVYGVEAMRLLPNIRFGTERYPEKVARRLRVVNIAAWIAAATHALYAAVLLVDLGRFWWLIIANMVAALLYASAPLLHRIGPLAGPGAFTVLFYADMAFYVCLLGTDIGVQFYILIGPALAALYVGPERFVLSAVAGGVEFGVVDMAAGIDVAAVVADAAGLVGHPALPVRADAVQALGQDARDRGLAHATRPREEVGVVQPLLRQRIGQRLHDVLLAHQFLETVGAVLAGENLVAHGGGFYGRAGLLPAASGKSRP